MSEAHCSITFFSEQVKQKKMFFFGAPVTQFQIGQGQNELRLQRLTLSDELYEFWGQTNLQVQPKDGTENRLKFGLGT